MLSSLFTFSVDLLSFEAFLQSLSAQKNEPTFNCAVCIFIKGVFQLQPAALMLSIFFSLFVLFLCRQHSPNFCSFPCNYNCIIYLYYAWVLCLGPLCCYFVSYYIHSSSQQTITHTHSLALSAKDTVKCLCLSARLQFALETAVGKKHKFHLTQTKIEVKWHQRHF